MKITNTTHISIELLKAIATDVGLDLSATGELDIDYSTGTKQAMRDDNLGGAWGAVLDDGTPLYFVSLVPWASTEVLAHELRHLSQIQTLGWEAVTGINEMELETVGYEENVLEVDAREAGKRWKVA